MVGSSTEIFHSLDLRRSDTAGAMSCQSTGIPRSKRIRRPSTFSTRNDQVHRSGRRSRPGIGGPIKTSGEKFAIFDVESMIRTDADLPAGT